MTSITIRFRRGTAAQWASANPTLASGEPALETDTGVFKIGDGSSDYASLPAIGAGGLSGGLVDGPVTVQRFELTDMPGGLWPTDPREYGSNFVYIQNIGAFQLYGFVEVDNEMVFLIENRAAAGAVTFNSFGSVTGDSLTTTEDDAFVIHTKTIFGYTTAHVYNVSAGYTAPTTATLRDRATHTGTQLASTISDFATAVAATAAVTANTAKAPGVLRVPFQAVATGNVTMTNQANAEQFLGNSNRNITMVDLADFTEYRLHARVVTGSISVNSPRIYAEYHTSFTTTIGTYSQLGTSAVSVSLTTAGHVATAWTPLAAGAIADNIFLTVLQNGGDAGADPAVAHVVVEFR